MAIKKAQKVPDVVDIVESGNDSDDAPDEVSLSTSKAQVLQQIKAEKSVVALAAKEAKDKRRQRDLKYKAQSTERRAAAGDAIELLPTDVLAKAATATKARPAKNKLATAVRVSKRILGKQASSAAGSAKSKMASLLADTPYKIVSLKQREERPSGEEMKARQKMSRFKSDLLYGDRIKRISAVLNTSRGLDRAVIFTRK